MKKTVFILFPLFLFGIELKVNVDNIDTSRGGEIYVGVYNKAENFPKESKTYKYNMLKTKDKNSTTSFDLEDGIYAVALFHDDNFNKKLDKNFLGIPKEGYGLSNNDMIPSFDNAKFSLNKYKEISIEMRY